MKTSLLATKEDKRQNSLSSDIAINYEAMQPGKKRKLAQKFTITYFQGPEWTNVVADIDVVQQKTSPPPTLRS